MPVNLHDISLHVLDIANNAIQANSLHIKIVITENNQSIDILIEDDGDGISPDTLNRILNKTYEPDLQQRGLGIPWFKYSIERTGGKMTIQSTVQVGTTIHGHYYKNKNCPIMGDIQQTIRSLVYGNESIDFYFQYNKWVLDTKKMKEVLQDVPLSHPKIREWLESYMKEGIKE